MLQEGDRVLSINGVALTHLPLHECRKLLNESGMRITLLVEFDVAGAYRVTPSSVTWLQKLV